VPRSWPHGYCPICASWPILAERRGLDRTRRLRCGRCGGDWPVEWLCCIYCGERDHQRLGSLVPEDREETLIVETCASCRGYLKSVATLQQIPPFALLLQDLETVELDLVALDRGYSRPQGGGFPLDVRVTARPSRPIWRALRDG
jgi:FdhE protein